MSRDKVQVRPSRSRIRKSKKENYAFIKDVKGHKKALKGVDEEALKGRNMDMKGNCVGAFV